MWLQTISHPTLGASARCGLICKPSRLCPSDRLSLQRYVVTIIQKTTRFYNTPSRSPFAIHRLKHSKNATLNLQPPSPRTTLLHTPTCKLTRHSNRPKQWPKNPDPLHILEDPRHDSSQQNNRRPNVPIQHSRIRPEHRRLDSLPHQHPRPLRPQRRRSSLHRSHRCPTQRPYQPELPRSLVRRPDPLCESRGGLHSCSRRFVRYAIGTRRS
jgi:hypothetical protein